MKFRLLFCLIIFGFYSYSQDTENAKRIISTLASPGFKGRGYCDNGDKISSDFIANEFKTLGLLPLNKKSYFQYFDISANTFPGNMSVKINNTGIKPGADYLVDASSPSIKGTFSVYKCTRKDISTQKGLYLVIHNAEGSFLIIDNRDKKNESADISGITEENINFLKYSPALHISGLMIITSEKLSWEPSTQQGSRVVIYLNMPVGTDTITSLGIDIESKYLRNYETRNVAGYLKGKSVTDSTIVLLAHYDHLGMMGKDVYFPGANDNASGVAMLLDLAKYFSQNKPKYKIIFVALSGEESGLLGASAFIADPLTDLSKIKFLINFDLAGTGDEGIKVVNGSVYKDKFDFLVSLNEKEKLLPKVEIRGEACNSDHCMFYRKGVPCFYIYTLGGIKAYHDIYDRPETLPLTGFAGYRRLMIEFIKSL